METERIAVAVRPRASLEAADLGVRLARANFAKLFGAHALVVLAIAGSVALALPEHLVVAAALIWWLKPLYDRVAVYVLSIALLGKAPGVIETLSALPRIVFGTGLFTSLTWLRLTPTRCFYTPVLQLEGLRGGARRQRSRVLAGSESSTALGILSVCGALEAAIVVAGLQLAATFQAEGTLAEFWSEALSAPTPGLLAYEVALYVLAICAVEPLYVAAGFALYINRRVWLEGWDVELAFRRLERRARSVTAVAALCLAVGLSLAPAPGASADAPACPVDSAEDARPCIDRVLAAPEFATTEKVTIWRPRDMGGDFSGFAALYRWIANAVSTLMRVGAWLALPVVLAVLAVAIARGLQRGRAGGSLARAQSELRRGFDLRPESLPDDVLAAARARFAAGDPSAALSLLYRAALVELARRFSLRLPASATEGECERIARGASDPGLVSDFLEVSHAWLLCAYAHRPPRADEFDGLCRRWASGFGARA